VIFNPRNRACICAVELGRSADDGGRGGVRAGIFAVVFGGTLAWWAFFDPRFTFVALLGSCINWSLTKIRQLGFKHSHETGDILPASGLVLLILGAKNVLLYANPLEKGNADAVWRLLVTLWRMLWWPWKSRSVEA
jgi:hypothetical protein